MIAVVCALKEEFNTSKCPILYTGIGKLKSAISLTKFIHDNPTINHYINFGTAGGITADKDKIIECTKFTDGDVALDFNPRVHSGPNIFFNNKGKTAVSFNNFKTNLPNYKEWDCVDMESYSLALVCKKFQKSFSCFKYISDKVGEESQFNVWEKNMKKGSIAFEKILNKFI